MTTAVEAMKVTDTFIGNRNRRRRAAPIPETLELVYLFSETLDQQPLDAHRRYLDRVRIPLISGACRLL